MPIQRDAAALHGARKFCEDFLAADGLALVVNVLQKDVMQADVDYDTRQGMLRLSRYSYSGRCRLVLRNAQVGAWCHVAPMSLLGYIMQCQVDTGEEVVKERKREKARHTE